MDRFEHQLKGVKLLSEHDSFGLFWDMGTGKTLTMLTHLSNLILAGEVDRALWVAPKSALGAVERDIRTLRNNGESYRADALEEVITCINYEKLSRKDSKWRKMVDSVEWDALVLDEAHCVARPTSNRTKYIVGDGKTKGLASRIKYRYVMTGTPVTNSRLEDFWSFMRLMELSDYYTYPQFETRYLKTRNLPGSYAKIITGYTNQDELVEDVASYSQSVLKEECLDLPERMPDEVIRIPFKGGTNGAVGKTTKQLYDDALENVIEATEEVFDNPLVKVLRLRQIASGTLPMDGSNYHLASDKVPYAMELIENNHNKTVVFYQFTGTFERMCNALDKAGMPYLYLNGQQPDKNVWMKFQESSAEECRVFLVQYQSGNAGIDLYTATDTIYMEPCNSSTVLEQSRSRTHRNGVTRACTYTFLLTEGSIEEDVYACLKEYQDFNEKLWIELKQKEKEV